MKVWVTRTEKQKWAGCRELPVGKELAVAVCQTLSLCMMQKTWEGTASECFVSKTCNTTIAC
jgi:hypothetical protein